MQHAVLCAQLMQLRILADDIIVSGTDGLFDNVFAEEVASLVTFARKRGDSPALAATVLASYTQMKAADTTHMSPFAYAAQVGALLQPLLVVGLGHMCSQRIRPNSLHWASEIYRVWITAGS